MGYGHGVDILRSDCSRLEEYCREDEIGDDSERVFFYPEHVAHWILGLALDSHLSRLRGLPVAQML